jgi:hypothetical protein
MEAIKEAIPESLKMLEHNPLLLLHDAFDDEGRFRPLLSDYHAQFQQLEIATDTRLPAKLLAPLQAMRDSTRSSLEQNEHFQNLRPKWKEKLIKQPSWLKIPDISQRAGISPGYHHSSYEFCSSFIHGSLHAMQSTERAKPQTDEGKRFFERLVDIVCGYVALAVRDSATSCAPHRKTFA